MLVIIKKVNLNKLVFFVHFHVKLTDKKKVFQFEIRLTVKGLIFVVRYSIHFYIDGNYAEVHTITVTRICHDMLQCIFIMINILQFPLKCNIRACTYTRNAVKACEI